MSSSKQLKGIALVDCARASATQGLEAATQQCGYGEDSAAFLKALDQAGKDMGLDISGLSDLVNPADSARAMPGVEISPDTPSQL